MRNLKRSFELQRLIYEVRILRLKVQKMRLEMRDPEVAERLMSLIHFCENVARRPEGVLTIYPDYEYNV